ncbi:MFS transporter, partial [Burkholderia pseudomallei]
GAVATVALVVLRIAQGIAIGREWGGALLMASEHASADRRTFVSSFAQLGSPAGLILAQLAFRLVAGIEHEAYLAWGWR